MKSPCWLILQEYKLPLLFPVLVIAKIFAGGQWAQLFCILWHGGSFFFPMLKTCLQNTFPKQKPTCNIVATPSEIFLLMNTPRDPATLLLFCRCTYSSVHAPGASLQGFRALQTSLAMFFYACTPSQHLHHHTMFPTHWSSYQISSPTLCTSTLWWLHCRIWLMWL